MTETLDPDPKINFMCNVILLTIYFEKGKQLKLSDVRTHISSFLEERGDGVDDGTWKQAIQVLVDKGLIDTY